MATKIKVLASQWRQGNVTFNGTEIELTAEIEAKYVYVKAYGVKLSQSEADIIEDCKANSDLLITNYLNSMERDGADNYRIEGLARAWLNGYTIEKEKRYRVELYHRDKKSEFDSPNGVTWKLYRNIQNNDSKGDLVIDTGHRSSYEWQSEFTESEINEIGPRYMAFAVEVSDD